MKLIKKASRVAAVILMTAALGSCNIYTKYHTPTDTPLTQAYAEARSAAPDSNAFGNLLWEDVFTDPVLVQLINTALTNNTSLQNAMLNVDVARANMRGAQMAYLPSVALAPNAARASYDRHIGDWT